jgi:RNA polymerase sigma factor for flagellar operon FliA
MPAQAYAPARDLDERDRLVLQHLPQVHYIARRIHNRLPAHVPLADLVQAGVLGLMDALERYDAERNVQFQSYANFRIRGAILDSLRELDWGPRELRRQRRKLQEVTARLENELGRTASESEIADALGLALPAFQQLLGELKGLDLTGLYSDGDNEDGEVPIDVPSDPEAAPDRECLRREIKQLLAQAIAELPAKEQQVLSLYYYEELTMKDIGAVLSVGESRVSQIHSLAVMRLRSRLTTMLAGGKKRPASREA